MNGLSLLFLSLFLAKVCAESALGESGPAAIGDRDFPSDLKFEDWTLSNDRVNQYVNDVITQSGGAGAGLGIIFSIAMTFHLFIWGFCCCRRTPGNYPCGQTNCAKLEYKNYWRVLAVVTILTAIGGTISIFINSSTVFESVIDVHQKAVNTLQDGEDFLCSGTLPGLVRGGSSINELRVQLGGNRALIALCTNNSVGNFLKQVDERVNNTVNSGLETIDSAQDILAALNSTRDSIQNVSDAIIDITTDVSTLFNETIDVNEKFAEIRGFGKYSNEVPSDIDEVEQSTVDENDQAAQDSRDAVQDYENTYQDSFTTIRDQLGEEVRADLIDDRETILSDIAEVEEQVTGSVGDLVSYENDVNESEQNVSDNEEYGEPVLAAIYSLSVIFLILMFVGYMLKSRLIICIGAYAIYIFFFWLCLGFGLILVISMVTYDVCGCENTFTTGSCSDMMTVFETNTAGTVSVGDTSVELQETVQPILLCPDTNSYSSDSNFIDILGVLQEFNFTSTVIKAIIDIEDAARKLNQTENLDSARANVEKAVNGSSNTNFTEIFANTDFDQTLVDLRSLNTTLAALQADTSASNTEWVNRYYIADTSEIALAEPNNTQAIANLGSIETSINTVQDILSVITNKQDALVVRADTVLDSLDDVQSTLNTTSDLVGNIGVNLRDLSGFILTINEFTPCGFVGNFYSGVVIESFCEETFTHLDSVTPGAIACLTAMLFGFFVISMMAGWHIGLDEAENPWEGDDNHDLPKDERKNLELQPTGGKIDGNVHEYASPQGNDGTVGAVAPLV
mmetsp:Transcript_2958/g.4353  ORF Transcript_2958/g.4353 Transcript_2958/m.4353 type:complete len:794 (+) Transcript_2958:37-2418(+)